MIFNNTNKYINVDYVSDFHSDKGEGMREYRDL